MKSQQKYREDNDQCPVCDSDNVVWDTIYSDSGGASRKCFCLACESRWYENYVLTGYTMMSPPDLETPDE